MAINQIFSGEQFVSIAESFLNNDNIDSIIDIIEFCNNRKLIQACYVIRCGRKPCEVGLMIQPPHLNLFQLKAR